MKIKISVSIGEFIDKMSILQIKEDNGLDVEKELIKYLTYDIVNQDGFKYYLNILKSINNQLWNLEDRKRKQVDRYSRQESDVAFLITHLNDLRFRVKKSADVFFNSSISEEKSHL